ncbi:PHP domain-containing protein [Clostridium sp. CF012]|uniref:PHP domain-containing protein n=1 Tax=Clostridium sp. CF012 TaxID=2843319 RepID=UPI00209B8FDC|nr:PHP domain-containing protein [Clostridium sp. CF012]
MHSNVSIDGEFSPKELMEFCFEADVKVVALADHNSVRGVMEAKLYADQFGLQLIPAIELDCRFRGVDLHVLGYGIDVTYEAFEKIEQSVYDQERLASRKRMVIVKQMGIAFDNNEVMKLSRNGVVTGEMIAEVALKDDANKNNTLMSPFYPNGERSDNPYVNFYWDICSMGKGAYVPMEFMSLIEAIELIYAAGGIPILAHPGNNVNENEELIRHIVQVGIVGLEVYSSYHSADQIQFYASQVEKYGLIKTIGSDFHGKTKPAIKLGDVHCQNSEEEIYHALIRKLSKSRSKGLACIDLINEGLIDFENLIIKGITKGE